MIAYKLALELAKKKALAEKAGKKLRLALPIQLDPRGPERRYVADLRRYARELTRLIKTDLFPKLPSLIRSAEIELGLRTDADFDDELDVILLGIGVRILEEYSEDRLREIALQRGIEVSKHNFAQWAKTVKKVAGIDLFASEPWLRANLDAFATENVNLITKLTRETLDDIKQRVTRAIKQGVHPSTLAKELQKRFGFTRYRATLIARDQVAKFNGQLTGLRQTEAGVKRYRWRTSRDERVRTSHKVLEGKIYSWDKNAPVSQRPPEGPPGFPINCRCYAEPVLEDILENQNPFVREGDDPAS